MDTKQFSTQIRKIILERSFAAHVGHIGSALSIADIVAVLYTKALHSSTYQDPDRDRFILSKGHAALALYAALCLKGWITEEILNSFLSDGSALGVHPEHAVSGIDFCTGSLGQGITYGVGAALAARLQNSTRRAFVLLSDAECNEGAVWEAAMFAAHHQLSNLIVIIDLNGQQAFGYTDQVINMSPMSARWSAFGWQVSEVDGNNVDEIENVVNGLDTLQGPPHVVIARTVFGKGVSFMENQIKWHYLPLSLNEYQVAMQEIEK